MNTRRALTPEQIAAKNLKTIMRYFQALFKTKIPAILGIEGYTRDIELYESEIRFWRKQVAWLTTWIIMTTMPFVFLAVMKLKPEVLVNHSSGETGVIKFILWLTAATFACCAGFQWFFRWDYTKPTAMAYAIMQEWTSFRLKLGAADIPEKFAKALRSEPGLMKMVASCDTSNGSVKALLGIVVVEALSEYAMEQGTLEEQRRSGNFLVQDEVTRVTFAICVLNEIMQSFNLKVEPAKA